MDYHDSSAQPLYPFGFGLSYTEFGYRDLCVEPTGPAPSTRFHVTVTAENRGAHAGAEVVQLYLRDKAATVVRRVAELKAFEKIILQPGESRQVNFVLGDEETGLWNPAMRWTVEPGKFEVRVGGDSRGCANARVHRRSRTPNSLKNRSLEFGRIR